MSLDHAMMILDLEQDLKRILEDPECENMRDVTLIGNDGGKVEASKLILAARSPVFQGMFYREFLEQESSTVNLDYPAVVLRVVTRYSYCDKNYLEEIYALSDEVEMVDSEAVILLQLCDATRYLGLSRLQGMVLNGLARKLMGLGSPQCKISNTSCICAVLQELHETKDTTENGLWTALMSFVKAYPVECLLFEESKAHRGVSGWSFATLITVTTEISKDSPFVTVKVLKKWYCIHGHSLCDEDRETLKVTASGIDLQELSPEEIAVVDPCDLFPITQLFGALKYRVTHRVFHFRAPTGVFPTAIVHGAGDSSANGKYMLNEGTYEMKGKYNDVDSQFLISNATGKWSLLVKSSETSSEPNPIIQTLYTCSLTSATKSEVPPFAGWECVEGTHPSPTVASIGVNPFNVEEEDQTELVEQDPSDNANPITGREVTNGGRGSRRRAPRDRG